MSWVTCAQCFQRPCTLVDSDSSAVRENLGVRAAFERLNLFLSSNEAGRGSPVAIEVRSFLDTISIGLIRFSTQNIDTSLHCQRLHIQSMFL